MSTDKTLADVQPGGRVRLGDQAERFDSESLWWLMDAASTLSEGGNESHAEHLRALHAALSAQPSPGGQGDWRAMLSQFGEDDPREGSRSNGHDGVDHNDWVDHAEVPVDVLARIATALVARQPDTDEQYANEQALIDHLDGLMDDGGQGGEKWPPAQAAIAGIIAARQPVGEPVTAIGVIDEDEGGFIVQLYPSESLPVGAKVYTAPPAQAVELGRIRSTVQALLNWIDDWAETPEESGIDAIEIEAAAVLDLIDSHTAGGQP